MKKDELKDQIISREIEFSWWVEENVGMGEVGYILTNEVFSQSLPILMDYYKNMPVTTLHKKFH
jgi:hypothetical protein